MPETREMHVVILAGGVGTRLWPVSRKTRPKQFQRLLSERTMLVDTYERVRPLTTAERVWVVTGKEFTELARSQLPEVPPANILGEPVGRSSAPAAAFAVAHIRRLEPEAVVLASPADSFIGDAVAYADYVGTAAEAAAEGFIVTLGVIPSRPDTSLGYIKRGRRLERPAGAYRVEHFTEKPAAETAERYLADGGYYWNMGHFVFGAAHFMERCAVHLPKVAEGAERLAVTEDPTGKLTEEVYRDLPSVSLDYGIAEKEDNMAVVPTAVDWSDVGNWRAVKEIAARRGSLQQRPGNHIGVDSPGCFVMAGSGRLIVTVGVEDHVIIDTEDALLIVQEEKAQEVREALAEIKRRGKETYL